MKTASDTASDGEFRDFVVGLIPSLKLTVSNIEVSNRHEVKLIARSDSENVIVEARNHKRKVGHHPLEALKAEMDKRDILEGIFISMAGFTGDAQEYSVQNRIMLFTPEELKRRETQAASPPVEMRKIFERVFSGPITLEQAAAEFMRRRRKSILGLFGVDERIEAVDGRFAPIGCFRLRKSPFLGAALSPRGKAEGEINVYVNLHTCSLLYVSRGLTGGKLTLKATNIVRRMLNLSPDAVKVMSQIFEHGELRFDGLTPEQQFLLQKNVDNIILLQNLGLISTMPRGNGYLSNINLLTYGDKRYDLEANLACEESAESSFGVDEILYSPQTLLLILKNFYDADGQFVGVTYMPYYLCRYATSDGRLRFDTIENIRLKNG